MNSRHGSDLGKGEIAKTAKATYGPMGDYRVAAGITDHDKRDSVFPFSTKIQALAGTVRKLVMVDVLTSREMIIGTGWGHCSGRW